MSTKPQVNTTHKLPESVEEMVIGPRTVAGILLENNAGWRVRRPVFDMNKCIRCLNCWVLCPEGVIEKSDLSVDWGFCKGCGLCARECPKGAITMVDEASFKE